MKNKIKMFVIDRAYEILLVIQFVISSLVWMSLENRYGVLGFWIGFLFFCWTLDGVHMAYLFSRSIRERYLELQERIEALEASKPESAKTSDNI